MYYLQYNVYLRIHRVKSSRASAFVPDTYRYLLCFKYLVPIKLYLANCLVLVQMAASSALFDDAVPGRPLVPGIKVTQVHVSPSTRVMDSSGVHNNQL